jgi:hypothetical protein
MAQEKNWEDQKGKNLEGTFYNNAMNLLKAVDVLDTRS